MVEFANEPVGPGSLPRLQHEHFEPVDPNLLRVSLIGMAAFATSALAVGAIVTVVLSRQNSGTVLVPLYVALVVVGLTAVAAVLRLVEIRHIAYQVRTHDISYRSGVLVRRVSTVPFVRVQHARIRQGPIQRRFSISTLEVNSAGPDLHIHGLPAETAERLRALVVERAGDLEETG